MPRQKQLQLDFHSWKKRSHEKILNSVYKLRAMHKKGALGGEVMPEDANPALPKDSKENYHYFTLPMALNYQRNSYTLWRAAAQTYNDIDTREVFYPSKVLEMDHQTLRSLLTTYKVAIQKEKHTAIWKTICQTICSCLDDDMRNLFIKNNGHIPDILNYVQVVNKRGFPYLSGPKICNYWLYVIEQYTDAVFTEREALTIAPDTHVIQASIRLGLVDPQKQEKPELRDIVSDAWKNVLDGTGILPIDIHTPLWLWSRGGFIPIKA